MEPKSLATIGRQVGQQFAQLVADTDGGHCSGYIREILIDQMQRFLLWAGNMALCSYGHHSLDYRCRDAPKVYEYGHQLLTDLEDTLNLIMDECNSLQMETQNMSREAEEESEGLGLNESDTPLDGEEFIDDEGPQGLDEPLVKLASDNIRTTIDRLYRLSFRIRNPATRLGFSEAKRHRLIAEDGTDLTESFAAIDLKHIDDLMAKHLKMSPEESRNHFLVKRLARANTNRRQQFGLWRIHGSRVEQLDKRTGGPEHIESHNETSTTSQQIPGTIPQPSTATGIQLATATSINASIGLDDSQSVFSSLTRSTWSREDQGREIIIPRLPDKVRGKDFECPYCYILCPGRISDGPAWKSHVFRDLRPYICTYEYCTEADQQYDSITDWIAHEYYNHTKATHFPAGTYSGDCLASQQEEIFRPPGLYDVCREQCPICDEERPSVSHVGHHLRKIAAFTLPSSMTLEDDIAPVSQDSNEANLESDENPAEMRSEFELEDAEEVSYRNPPPTSLQQNLNQKYHPIVGPERQLHANQPPDQPIDIPNVDFCRVLYEITPENQPPTPGIDLEAKPGDLVVVISKYTPTGDASESWLCRARDGRQGYLPRTYLEFVRKGAQPQAQIQDGAMANTMTTLATPRANLLSSNTVKQLGHSSQTGLLAKDYPSSLDYDGSEEDAGQWSEVNSQQASVSGSLGPSRPDGHVPGQTPDDRIVESQYQDMMKKSNWQTIPEEAKPHMMAHSTRGKRLLLRQERLVEHQAKQREMPVAQSTNVARITTPAHLSFYVRIEPLSPDYGGEAIHHAQGGHWVPPNTPNGIRNGQDPSLLLLWEDGRNIIVPANDATQVVGLDRHMYRVATIFTQHPDTPHLLTVPYNARTRGVSGRGWQCVTFNHIQVGNSNAYYSYISTRGAEQRLAAPTPRHWSPELLPNWYNCDPPHVTRAQAGLIGELPLLFALAAFSAPPHRPEVLSSSLQPGEWISHGLATGRIPERGMIVTVYLDPLNPERSTPHRLDGLQNGRFGPFYGP